MYCAPIYLTIPPQKHCWIVDFDGPATPVLLTWDSTIRMAGDPDTILASLQLSSQSLGVESFEDLLPDLPPDETLTGGYAKRN